jgi:ATP-dependent Zn protease
VAGPRLADVAYHESGHVIVALRCGRQVRSVTIADDRSGLARVLPPTNYPRTSASAAKAAREDLMIALAGPTAEARTRELPNWWRL